MYVKLYNLDVMDIKGPKDTNNHYHDDGGL